VSAAAQDPFWKRAAIAAWLAVAAVSAWLFIPIAGGYFVSDDFVPPVLFAHWQANGTFGHELAAKFWGGLDAGENHFYRPLSYLSLAANYLVSGTNAAPWMAVNAVLHVASGVLVAAIGVRLARAQSKWEAAAAGAAGAALFLFMATSAEVAAWISGRFDAFATFFTLLACYAFLASRRALDTAWWIALAAGEAAVLSKESSAIMPAAILAFAFLRSEASPATPPRERVFIAVRDASPWLAIAALYLVSRLVFFGSMTRVYGSTNPLATALSMEHWRDIARLMPDWLGAQFTPSYRFPFLVALTAAQVVLVYIARPAARTVLAVVGAVVVATLVLLLPHVDTLAKGILGGRLLYQTVAFYAILVVVGLCHARLRYLAWGTTLGLVLMHAGFMHHAMKRWEASYGQMRALVVQIDEYQRALAPGDYAVILVPGPLNGIPFARNAQGGLMLPPFFDAPITSRVVVQLDEELPDLPGKIREGLVSTLRARSVFDYMDGKRIALDPPEYPTRAACWDPSEQRLYDLTPGTYATPEEFALGLRRSLGASPCPKPEL